MHDISNRRARVDRPIGRILEALVSGRLAMKTSHNRCDCRRFCAFRATARRAGDLRLTIANGRVTIVAQDVSLRQILDEWGRVGQTKVVGAERLTGPPVTLELARRARRSGARIAAALRERLHRQAALGHGRRLALRSHPHHADEQAAGGRAQHRRRLQQPRAQPQVVMPNVIVDDDEPTPNGIMPPGTVPPQFQQFQGPPPPPMTQPGMQPVQPGTQPGAEPTMTRPGMLPPPAPNPNMPAESVSDQSAAAACRQAARPWRARRTVARRVDEHESQREPEIPRAFAYCG